MSELTNMLSASFIGLTNDLTYYARVYPMNPDGVAQSEIGTQIGSAVPMAGLDLAALPEGTVVMLNESGVPTAFYVAKHDYESGLNGAGRTLLVRKEGYDLRAWGSNNAYASSSIDTWLNGTYKALLDAQVQQKMGETKFYYIPGNGTTSVGQLSRAVFILSHTELGLSFSYSKAVGTALPIASTLKIAKKNGNPVSQWTRSPRTDNTTSVVAVTDAGAATSGGASGTPQRYSCPCFTLPADTKFSMEPNADGSYTLL